MKLFKIIIAVFLLTVITVSCKNDKKEEAAPDETVTEEVVVEEKVVTPEAEEVVEEETAASEGAETAASEGAEISIVYPKDAELVDETGKALKRLVEDNPEMKGHFNSAYGFVIFPVITKGGLVVGGAGGKGLTFENKSVIGMAKLAQATIGAQVGGQQYMEVIFFEDKAALDRFKAGKLKFSGQVSAVALEKGTSVDLDYQDGVSVFTKAKGGLMAEASLGGQKFTYEDGV